MDDTKACELETLLDTIADVSRRHPSDTREFNPLTILRNANEEVGLHSRFIAALLDPKVAHGHETTFLKLFLQEVGVDGFALNGCLVQREKMGIDILITNRRQQAVIIENKIHAADAEAQIERYVGCVGHTYRSVTAVIYLTLDRRNPSAQSIGSCRAPVHTASYRTTILSWLDRCSKTADGRVLEAIKDYAAAVKRVTGQTASRRCTVETANILLKPGNLKLAIGLVGAIDEAKAMAQELFWAALEKALDGHGMRILEHQRYSPERIRHYYEPRRDRWWYGLMFELPQSVLQKDVKLALYIEAGKDEGVVFGLTLVGESGIRTLEGHADYGWIREIVMLRGAFKQHPSWLGYRPVEPALDFTTFADESTASFGDPVALKKVVTAIATDILETLRAFKDECSSAGHERAAGLAAGLPCFAVAGDASPTT
jgi:hypothetical protein